MNTENHRQAVITDVKMPLMSMVIFMVKFEIASIPAFIILGILGTVTMAMLGGIFGGMGRF